MFKRMMALWLLAILCLLPCLQGLAEEGDPSYSFFGASWGMTKDEIRTLVDSDPYQEPAAATGHSALVYRATIEDMACIVQYGFLPDGALYNIEIMAPDADRAFFGMITAQYAADFGDPLTAEDASMESDDPAAVMMAGLMQSTTDTDFLGWNADEETVIVVSFDPVYEVCYAEIRRYTDYFRFVPDAE